MFAVYYPGIKEAVRQHADQLAGKVVVDIPAARLVSVRPGRRA